MIFLDNGFELVTVNSPLRKYSLPAIKVLNMVLVSCNALFLKFQNAASVKSQNYFIVVSVALGIIHLVRTQNFPENSHLLPPDKHT